MRQYSSAASIARVCVLCGAFASGCGSDSSAKGPSSGGAAGAGASSGSGGSSSGGTSAGGGAGGTGAVGGASGGSGGGSTAVPTVGGCPVFTADDEWNRDVSQDPVDASWTQKVQALVGSKNIHPDYGSGGGSVLYGIPFNVVPATQPAVNVAFDWWPNESDPSPYPFPGPGTIAIEGGEPTNCSGDCHVLVVQQGSCALYEGYACEHQSDGWHCGNGAKWDLTKNSYGQRPKGWTSADAAGLPILPGLLRYDEVVAGAVEHALRFTLSCTMNKYVAPATHFAVPSGCQNEANAPPMGLRVRLKADFDISSAPPSAQVILTAMKKYGMILADNGSDFYFQGEANPGWSNAEIAPLKQVPASAFEVVSVPPLEP